jgi:hypothetical protein
MADWNFYYKNELVVKIKESNYKHYNYIGTYVTLLGTNNITEKNTARRTSRIILITQYSQDSEIWEAKMGWSCSEER